MTARTRARVSARTPVSSLSTRDTVLIDTPARAATSSIVVRAMGRLLAVSYSRKSMNLTARLMACVNPAQTHLVHRGADHPAGVAQGRGPPGRNREQAEQ